MDITVIMPALDEEENIEAAISNTLKVFDDYEIIGEILVINDGSTDDTPGIVRRLSATDSRIHLIKHEAPMGIGASYWEGVDSAKGKVVTWLPGDNENDPWETLRYYKLTEHVDIVIPFVFNREVPFFQKLAFLHISLYY